MSCYVRIDPNHVLVDHAKVLMFSFKREISLLQMGLASQFLAQYICLGWTGPLGLEQDHQNQLKALI